MENRYNIKSGDYINILAPMVQKLKLSGNNLLVFALIHGYSKDDEHSFHGSINYISCWLNISRNAVIDTLKVLVDSNYITKKEYFKNSVKFCEYKSNYEELIKKLNGGCEIALPVAKTRKGSAKTRKGSAKTGPGSAEMQPNIDIYIDKDIDTKEKKDTIVSKESECFSEIVEYWNTNAKSYSKVRSATDKVKKAIKARLKDGYSLDEIKKAIMLMESLSDFYKGKEKGKEWKADFFWLINNTNSNFDKIINGALHRTNEQQKSYNDIMNMSSDYANEYHPQIDRMQVLWNEDKQIYTTFKDVNSRMFYDGYKDEDRPESAVIMACGVRHKWSKKENKWIKL